MITEKELTPLLQAFGLLPPIVRPVARPHLTKDLARQLGKIRKRYRAELLQAQQMRADILNLTRGVARPRIVAELVEEGHTEAAYLLSFNNDQLVILLAWQEARGAGRGSSSQGKAKTKRKQGAPTSTAKRAGRGSSSQGKAKTKQKKDEPTP
jgi:hypothetical protein